MLVLTEEKKNNIALISAFQRVTSQPSAFFSPGPTTKTLVAPVKAAPVVTISSLTTRFSATTVKLLFIMKKK